jgi:hypothetical protein
MKMKLKHLLPLAAALCGFLTFAATSPGGLAFKTPEDAVAALQKAALEKNTTQLRAIFGPEVENISNPDPVEATNEVASVAKAMGEYKNLVKAADNRMILEFGADKTLFPVPLVKTNGQWYFDTIAGEEELVNRRVGRNELETLEAMRTYVAAQREYAMVDRDGDEVLEFAQKFASLPGRKDGLYWSPEIDGSISPLGPLVAEASAAGYRKKSESDRQSFHGYFFRILTKQGKNAAGGAYDYVINGNMIGGFGLIAWPAEYDETGVMTFIVNQQGRVYQKDLGDKTSEVVQSINAYDPDKTWAPSAD